MSKIDFQKRFAESPFAYRLHNFVFLFDKIADDVLQREHGITLSQFVVLKILTHTHDCKQKNIAEKLHMTEGAISRQIERLRENGFITRTTNKSNRREHEINVTEKGMIVRKNALETLSKEMAFIGQALTDEEMSHFENAIEKLHECVVKYTNS